MKEEHMKALEDGDTGFPNGSFKLRFNIKAAIESVHGKKIPFSN
jgi:hypothetical protein